MKRVLCAVLLVLTLSGCGVEDKSLQRCMDFRQRLLSEGCAFTAVVTADFGEAVYTFTLECQGDGEGNLSFSVAAPEEIAGIGGTVSAGQGRLVFSDTVLAFPLLAEGEVSPVSAPWLMLQALRSGYLSSAGMEGDRLRLSISDSFSQDPLGLDVWFDGENRPEYAEIAWQGRRVVSIEIKEFCFV